MKFAERRRARHKQGRREAMERPRPWKGRRRKGIGPAGVAALFICLLVALLLLTMHASSQYSGKSIGTQLYEAVFVTSDME